LFFGIAKLENVSNKNICILPITKDTKLTDKKINKLFRILIKQIDSLSIDYIVLSTYLGKIDLLRDKLYSEKIKMLKGNILFEYLIYDVISYIAQEGGKEVSELEVSILANNNTELLCENIKFLGENVKKLNILTNNISQFKKLEDYLYEKLGIMINISNNKKKGLLNSHIIINMDFNTKLINKYNISKISTIVNIPRQY